MAGGREVIDDKEIGRPEPEPRHEPPVLPPNAGVVFHRIAVGVALACAFCEIGRASCRERVSSVV